jgi:putative ABC transport system permease protein
MGLRRFFFRRQEDVDLARELEAHIAHQVDENVASGMSQQEARRQAHLSLGNLQRLREDVWQWNTLTFFESMWQDFRYALRRLRSSPGFTAVSVLTLALAIGATTAIFSAVNPILFESLPYPHAGRIMAIWETTSEHPHSSGTFGMYRGLAERSRSFATIAVLKGWQPTLTGGYEPERLEGQRVSASYFQVLGVLPFRGRDFQLSDDRLNGPNVVILSDALWHRRFAGDPEIIGRQIMLDDNSYEVIGVMPRDFENVLSPAAELWAPLQYDVSQGRAWGHHLRTIGRLHPGVSARQARQELNVLGPAVLTEQHPETYGGDVKFLVSSLQDDITSGVKPALLAVFGAVILVLTIACVNMANLLLARGVQRRNEFAVRAALGAGGSRLVRQLLTESLVLAASGGAAGMALAMLGIKLLVALMPANLPRAGAVGVDGTVLIFGLAITALVGFAFGLIPALQSAWTDPHQGLGQGSRQIAGTHTGTRRALVIAEVAVALVLLVSSGLLLRSLGRLFAIDAGFDASHLLTMQIQTTGHKYEDTTAVHRFFDAVLEAARQVPGVSTLALTSQVPLGGDIDEYGARFEANSTRPAESYSVFRYAVSPGYVATMNIPLLSGRQLDEHDIAGAPLAALVSESLARRRFAQADPIGQRLQLGPTGPYTIVGVVGDVKQLSLALNQSDAVYITTKQWQWADATMSLMVRTRGDAIALVPAIRHAIWSADKDQPIVRVATMDQLEAASEAERHFVLILFEVFALTALVLAAVGIYGVLSGSVTERMREIGVRSALGASRSDILGMVLRQGLSLTGLGVILGLAGAALASRALVTLLFGVSRLDPITYLGVVALLSGVSVIACWLPAWRAARVDPVIVLRTE